MSKKLEDLTLAEIKGQMSIYQTLYYKKRKQEDPEFAEKMRVLPQLICILFTYGYRSVTGI